MGVHLPRTSITGEEPAPGAATRAVPGQRRALWLSVAGMGVVAAVAVGAIIFSRLAPSPQPAQSGSATAEPPAPTRPTFDIVRVGPQGGAVMAGRAAPQSEVVIQDAGKEIGRAKADDRGDWVFTSDTPLAPGPQALTLTERDPDGSEVKGAGTVFLAVPDHQVAANAQPPVAVLTDPNGPHMLQSPSNQLSLGAVDYDETGALRLAGSAPAGALVRVYVDNKPVGEAVGDVTGHWTLSPTTPVSSGPHELRLDQLGQGDQVVARVEVPFTRDLARPPTLAEGMVVVRPGQNLWQMARHAYGSGVRFTVIYQANRSEIRDPNLIYPGQQFAMPSGSATSASPPSSSKSR